MIARAWQCNNGCAVFETVGVPSFCPHCGNNELYAEDDGMEQYDNYDTEYQNWEHDL